MRIDATGVSVGELDMEVTLFREGEEEIRSLHGELRGWPVDDPTGEWEEKRIGDVLGWVSRSPFSPGLVGAADVLDADAAEMARAATDLVETVEDGATDVVLVSRLKINGGDPSDLPVEGRLELLLGPTLRVLLDTMQADPATTVLVVGTGGLLVSHNEFLGEDADRAACRAADLQSLGDGRCWYLPHPVPGSWVYQADAPSLFRRMRGI